MFFGSNDADGIRPYRDHSPRYAHQRDGGAKSSILMQAPFRRNC